MMTKKVAGFEVYFLVLDILLADFDIWYVQNNILITASWLYSFSVSSTCGAVCVMYTKI